MMVEVFKTNVIDDEHANMLMDQIHIGYPHYRVNFDLDDCDKILRVENVIGYVDSSFLIKVLESFGFNAEILPDDDDSNEMNSNNNLILLTSIES